MKDPQTPAAPREVPDFKTEFAAVDRAADPRQFIRFLDTSAASEASRAAKRRTFEALALPRGGSVLDVGCGTGADVLALAHLLGEGGRAVGVDASEAMVAEARRRASAARSPADFRVGDAHALDFPDASFHGCRADRVFQYLEDPRRALGEMARVARPGGRVVVLDTDWDTFLVDASDARVSRVVLGALAGSIRNGSIGRRLPALFRDAGLVEIAVVPDTLLMPRFSVVDAFLGLRRVVQRLREAGVLAAGEGEAWVAEQEERDRAGRFFCSVTSFCVSGKKPETRVRTHRITLGSKDKSAG